MQYFILPIFEANAYIIKYCNVPFKTIVPFKICVIPKVYPLQQLFPFQKQHPSQNNEVLWVEIIIQNDKVLLVINITSVQPCKT